MMSKTQPRFYSTKKKRKIQDKAIDKPSQTEIAATQTTLDECETDICGIFASLKKIFTAQRNKLTGFHVKFATCGCTQDVPKSHGSKSQLSSPVHTVHNTNLIG